jgi:hypothetical protein
MRRLEADGADTDVSETRNQRLLVAGGDLPQTKAGAR